MAAWPEAWGRTQGTGNEGLERKGTETKVGKERLPETAVGLRRRGVQEKRAGTGDRAESEKGRQRRGRGLGRVRASQPETD